MYSQKDIEKSIQSSKKKLIFLIVSLGKEACFDRIVQRFGRRSTFVVIGNALIC